MVMVMMLVIITMASSPAMFVAPMPYVSRVYGSMTSIGEAVTAVLRESGQLDCSLFLLVDGTTMQYINVYADLSSLLSPMAIFEVLPGSADNSSDESELADAVAEVRQLRKLSSCVTLLVLSDDPAFLASFAESSLRGRLLVWATRLLVVTRLPLHELRRLLSSSWTFSMMNAMILNQEEQPQQEMSYRYSIYSHLPYTPEGPQVLRVASWSLSRGLIVTKKTNLFPEKFTNFYGSRVNVTALPYTPHWVEDVAVNADGTSTKIYGGTDYFLLSTIAEALNFSIHVLETSSWDEVATRVEERVSFMATVFHNVLPQRLERYDYSYTYEYGSLDFCVAMPGLRPQWQSLYYPLSDLVWASVLLVLVLVLASLYVVIRLDWENKGKSPTTGFGRVAETVFGILMWQSVVLSAARDHGSRVLVMAWMIFAFIVGTAYRGNLTAALTLPKYPPRVETLLQLVNTFDSVTMPPFGTEFIKFFKQSDSGVYKALAERMHIVPSVMEGLQQALENREAHVAGRRYMEQKIAKYFSLPDGGGKLYVGRESLLPGISAWPIPHDAPYRRQLDRLMMAVIEAGLYEKWSEDMLIQARRESRERLKEQAMERQQNGEGGDAEDEPNAKIKALTIVHMQGPLMLLAFGLLLASLGFAAELVTVALVSRM
ncbi:ionotropic receptor 21a-like isoform X2 [Penaeus chinensis]|nr:ionotropic receptor 21a-like isoform X2 [Penaeus chinensis]